MYTDFWFGMREKTNGVHHYSVGYKANSFIDSNTKEETGGWSKKRIRYVAYKQLEDDLVSELTIYYGTPLAVFSDDNETIFRSVPHEDIIRDYMSVLTGLLGKDIGVANAREVTDTALVAYRKCIRGLGRDE
jgi:hypothetical protein